MALFLGLWLALCGESWAQSRLADFLPQMALAEVFPGADRLGPPEGQPAAAPAYDGDRLLGWVVLNTDWVPATGYSGKPIQVAVGVDTAGKIVGGKLLKHSEPIVLVGIPEKRIVEFIQGYVGYDVLAHRSDARPPVDIVAGATVTVVVIGESITRAASKVVRAKQGAAGPAPEAAKRALASDQPGARTWEELLGDGSVRRLALSVGDINAAYANNEQAAARPEPGEAGDTFIDLHVALVSVPVIGRSLLGEQGYEVLRQRLAPGQQAVMVMANGVYSFRGSGFVRGGLFDRIEVIQGENSVRFRDKDYERLADVAGGAPDFQEVGLFTLPPEVPFDPAGEWRLQLLVSRAVGALEKAFLTFNLPYQLPELYLAPAKAPPEAAPPPTNAQAQAAADDGGEPLWQRMWRGKAVQAGVLVAALLLLTAAFFFQDWLVRRPRVLKGFRLSYLAFTLVFLGWFANAQLSVVNILTLSNALATGVSGWDFFLMDPLIFILWAAVAASLLFWARGAFCGWLCPFGALQEFVSLAAKKAHIPQISVPWAVHERLWPIKYIIFLGLFGLALYSLATGERAAEVEPFKTAIILKFIRDWPFAVYALLLLAAGLFIERFFCRYLCPLGAALAIPARIRMFDWLKRHRECGSPCQRCSNECPVQAIHPDGRINPNECIYCMHCQELYWDEHRCPHMIQVRLKRERSESMSPPPKTNPPPRTGGSDVRA